MPKLPLSKNLILMIAVAALGNFVDAFDLILFGVLRTASLKDIGVSQEALLHTGQSLLNFQLVGMILGGIFWGILADKKGRKTVLFASILLYSLANIANGMVHNVQLYALMRLVAGFGLAGELGVGVTLVSESLPKAYRGYGPMIIALFGALGALSAPLLYKFLEAFVALSLASWRLAYLIGGLMGLLLLLLRISVAESQLFQNMHHKQQGGKLSLIFTNKQRLIKYLACIGIGLPVWFCISILALAAPEIARAKNIVGTISAADAIFYLYAGLALGDICSGLLSQLFQKRKLPLYIFIVSGTAITLFFSLNSIASASVFYAIYAAIGFFCGYWALFVTVAAEQFGTNIRATASTSIPNMVRGAAIGINLLFVAFEKTYGIIHSTVIVALICAFLAIFSLFFLKETFSSDMDFQEN